ncbi:Imm47 family immunity protein [Oceanobacillus senegalensis]|uniref:Imm47 family immunity protein n=1 Tax=Oceanobacillus senegalensis TaxID=1936063 RepID=UPI001FE503CE|nr:Imm47 family immunity protein [Oceanobacillus senegalensis]
MNSIWFGEKPTHSQFEMKENILKASSEKEVLLDLIEIYKTGDFSQKDVLM